jgi:glycosyltransferase involved in cell wall biosynthesis/tetratricopeptide (TPR) repeat protein
MRRHQQGLPLVWSGALFDASGYADEARGFVLALDAAGIDVRADPLVWSGWGTQPRRGAAERIEHLLAVEPPPHFAHVLHHLPRVFYRDPRATVAVGRTMFETDGLPREWVARCNALDEIWVPSEFNRETFASAGVVPERLHTVPGGIDRELYARPPEPLELAGAEGFVFLSVLSWEYRKGWDVLVRAYVEEFTVDEGTTLVLKATPPGGRSIASCRDELEAFVRGELGRDPAVAPRIVLLDVRLGHEQLPRLYRAADAFVLPSRGEGWGRPFLEAMAAGLPAVGTRWGGNLAFMSDANSYLVDCELVAVPEPAWREVPAFRGRRWAEPSGEHLRERMRRVVARREEAAATGARAREDVLARWTWERAAERVAERLAVHGLDARARPAVRGRRRRPRVIWEGPQLVEHSLSRVNRALCRALLGSRRIDLSIAADENPLDGADDTATALPADVRVRHAWPPRFEQAEERRLVLVQPWELGSLPAAWLEPIETVVDEVWVPSSYVRDCYVRSGVDPDKVAVVPNGVDPLQFNPGVAPLDLLTAKRFRFLFVGGTIARKGADVLLDTYVRAFGPEDDVCLVVKDFGVDSFYRDQGLGPEIRRLQGDPGVPEILYLDADLPPELMGGLYRACQCLVHPYRGEGFALPVAEAMACGLPVLVTGHGACLDFCDSSVARLLPAREVRLPQREVGGLELVAEPWWAELDRAALAEAMRWAVDRPEEAAALGRRGSARVLHELTWTRAAAVAATRLEALTGARHSRRRPDRPRRRTEAAPRARKLSVCLIARDEEPFIARCLESVRGVADQVVVVDTGSSDRTAEIARGLGADVVELAWADDFAAARNESLRHARHDWILVLDADETLDPGSHEEVRRLVQGEEVVGYLLPMRNYLEAEGTSEVIEHLNLRLFPNHAALRYVGRDPHAQLRCLDPRLGFATVPCGVVLHHDGYRSDVAARRAKGERNRLALERAVRDEPHDPFHAYNLGLAYSVLGRTADAERELRRAIALSRPAAPARAAAPPPFLAAAHVSLAVALFRLERYVEAAAESDEALRLARNFPDAHVARGAALARLGRFDEALDAYDRALGCELDALHPPSDLACGGWKALLGKAEVHVCRGEWHEALACLDDPRFGEPREPAARLARAGALAGLGRADEAEAQLRRASEAADAAGPQELEQR